MAATGSLRRAGLSAAALRVAGAQLARALPLQLIALCKNRRRSRWVRSHPLLLEERVTLSDACPETPAIVGGSETRDNSSGSTGFSLLLNSLRNDHDVQEMWRRFF